MKKNINIHNAKIALSTDSSCTISKELAKKLNINVFPLNVIVDGEEYLDGISINQDQLCEYMRGGKVIKTSTPPPTMIVEYFKDLFDKGFDYVIHFTISSKLSSMFSLFTNISHDSFDDKVIVIDSYSVCSLMLSHVLYAHERLNEGIDIDIIVEEIKNRLNDNYVRFIPENLTALKNGGRISPAIAALGNLIGLKPVLSLFEGGLGKDSMTRNTKKSMKEIIDFAVKNYPLEKYDYTIVSFDGNDALLSSIKDSIKEDTKGLEVKVLPIAINVCAHAGPGTIGFIVSPRILNHSLNEYL